MTLEYNTITRCAYCGEPKSDKRLGCCGEVHFEEVPECPKCGCDLYHVRHYVTGIETFVMQCEACDYRSDPE